MDSIAARLRSKTSVISKSTCGLKSHCSGWCGSNKNTGGTPSFFPSPGYPGEGKKLGVPPVFLFEPHQPEQCDFKPQVLLDITDVFDRKRAAMESMEAQQYLWEYCSDLARRRGMQAVRNSGNKSIKYAEAYQRAY